ncbi:MAG: 2-deoxycytidine 5-triphosphate deaminase [Acidimicrobiales bacterium]|nr:2-deoxycytidine 5-triphosphate deaminase [Acidimicrobiales bacterium]
MNRFLKSLTDGSPRAEGVLAVQHLQRALDADVISADTEIPGANLQPASLDLRLGSEALRLRCSFLPNRYDVETRVAGLTDGEPIDLSGDGAILDKGRPYLIRLQERLALPPELRARANPKSSTGRADVFTRVITDKGRTFDDIRPGYHGALWLEVVPLSFAVRVREGLTLNQLRLSIGSTRLSDQEIAEMHRTLPLLYRGGGVVNDAQFTVSNGLFLGLNLKGDRSGFVGYRARNATPHLDLRQVGEADIETYWEQVHKEPGDQIALEPRRFYLLMSDEAVVIPATCAAEMTAYDPTSGELRTHYAGFFDPGFGYGRKGEIKGSTAALEVRAHDVPFLIEHRQPVCKLTFEHMLDEPDAVYGESIESNYQQQTSTLGKHFPRGPGAPPDKKPRSDDHTPQLFPG